MIFLETTILLETNFCKMEKNIQEIYRIFGLLMFVQRYYKGNYGLNKVDVRIVDCDIETIKKKLVDMLKYFDGGKFSRWYDPESTIFRKDTYGNAIDNLESAHHFHLREDDVRVVVQYAINNLDNNDDDDEEEEDY